MSRPLAATPPPTWLQLVEMQAATWPARDVLIAAPNGADIVDRRTYSGLARRARAIATALRAVAAPGSRVLCLFRDRLPFVDALFGCLHAGMIAVPTYPPRPGRAVTDARFQRAAGIVEDCAPALALTDAASARAAEWLVPLGVTVLEISEALVPDHLADDWRTPEVGPDTVAVLQYTSGSTSAPRGVVLTHRHLLANSEAIRRAFGHSSASRGVIWLPHEHDMGLVGGILQPLFAGTSTLLSSLHFVQEPVRWLRAITTFGATTSGGPNFGYQMCVDRIEDHDLEGIDLSGWDVAFAGAEVVHKVTLDGFARRFSDVGFRPAAFLPCYGLAEATLMVTCGGKGEGARTLGVDRQALGQGVVRAGRAGEELDLVGCGLPAMCDVRIARAETTTAAASGEVGEVLVSGESVAGGYWGRADDPAFHARLDGDPRPFLRTGDLGFLDAGRLFVAGRRKDVVIVDGVNHYPEDVERTIEGLHPDLRPGCGGSFGIETPGSEALVVVWELRRGRTEVERTSIAALIRSAVARLHAVSVDDVVLTPPGHVPRTESGKVRRFECRRLYLEGGFDDCRCTPRPSGDGDPADQPRPHAGA
jgi:acyl-CoA synthetase (AMP-forming)/AMP-acid ligase II